MKSIVNIQIAFTDRHGQKLSLNQYELKYNYDIMQTLNWNKLQKKRKLSFTEQHVQFNYIQWWLYNFCRRIFFFWFTQCSPDSVTCSNVRLVLNWFLVDSFAYTSSCAIFQCFGVSSLKARGSLFCPTKAMWCCLDQKEFILCCLWMCRWFFAAFCASLVFTARLLEDVRQYHHLLWVLWRQI